MDDESGEEDENYEDFDDGNDEEFVRLIAEVNNQVGDFLGRARECLDGMKLWYRIAYRF